MKLFFINDIFCCRCPKCGRKTLKGKGLCHRCKKELKKYQEKGNKDERKI